MRTRYTTIQSCEYIHANTCEYMRIHANTCEYYIHIYICICVCVCVCVSQSGIVVLRREAGHLDEVTLPLVLAAAAIGEHIAEVQVRQHFFLVVVNYLTTRQV